MAGGDVKLRLEAGQDMPVTTPGDYIYLKFADRDIRVTITDGQGVQKPVVMRVGDKYRPGPFKAFSIQNTDPANPAQVIMVVGEGDFNRQIIQGEVTVTPGIRTADGTFRDDRRFDISAFVYPKKNGTVTLSDGDTIGTREMPTGMEDVTGVTITEDGFIQVAGHGPNSFYGDLFLVTLDRTLTITDVQSQPDLYGGTESMSRVQYYKGHYYKINGPRIYRDDEQWLYLGSLELGRGHLANDLIYAVPNVPTAARALLVLDFDGNIVKEVSQAQIGFTQTITGLVWEPFGRTWTLKKNTPDDFFVYDENFNLLYDRQNLDIGPSKSSSGHGVAIGDVYYVFPAEDLAFRKVQLVDREKTLSGEAFPADCFNPLVRRDKASRETSAALDVTYEAGQAKIRGEVIKALIEMYYGAELEPGFDYMDHVYAIRIDNPNGPGLSLQKVSHSATFKATKITDQFSAALPSKIKLTVDDGLKFRNPLEY